MKVSEAFASVLDDESRRQRLEPRQGDPLYLHLSDLEEALMCFRSSEPLRILDYGCGASPYRSLFPNADYRRADATDAADLDYRVGDDQSIPECSGYFDLILSTQVLEHVRDSSRYLCECHRLLRPDGRLILSTHGIYEEHGMPYDFRRWTGNGLQAELTQHGFEVRDLYRLTTNGRALAFLLEQHGALLVRSRRNIPGLLAWGLHALIEKHRTRFHRWCDSTFATSRMVDSAVPHQTLEIGLLCVAVKR